MKDQTKTDLYKCYLELKRLGVLSKKDNIEHTIGRLAELFLASKKEFTITHNNMCEKCFREYPIEV